jgi:pancreatic triacylglycerol lipase
MLEKLMQIFHIISKGSKLTNYLLAVANTRVVGAMVAVFIQRLVSVTNAKPEQIHLIGYSLGAHVSGYVGERIMNPKIGRITGLDPAGPAFQSNNSNSRLDRFDADLVDIMHTDGGNVVSEGMYGYESFLTKSEKQPLLILIGFGIEAPLGHYDFYPNNGLQQPGCEKTRGVSNFLLKWAEGL